MNRIMKYAAAAFAAATAVSTLGGCEQLEKKAPEDTVAVSFGDTNIMLDEVTYMIRSMEYTYESYFGSNICGNDMGDGSGMTVGDYIKQMSLSQLRQTLVLNEYAKKNGIELSDDQKAKVDEAIEKLQTESEDYLEAVGATDELIEKTYTENAIANLVYMDLVADVDTTVGDDEFLRKKIAYVKLTPSELTETTAADGATTEVSSDEDSSEEASSIENTEAESESASKDVTTSTEEASSEKASTEAVSTEEASSENVSKLSSEASTEDSTEVETLSEEEQERQDAMNDAADKILSVIIKMTVTLLQQILRFPLVRMELLYIMQLHGRWQQTNALYIEAMTAASTSSAVLMITMRKHVRVPSIQRSKAERQHCSQRNMPRFRTILPSLR